MKTMERIKKYLEKEGSQIFLKAMSEGEIATRFPEILEKVKEGDVWEITVLFADICHYTKISNRMTPKEVINKLNLYYKYVNPIVKKHNGIIDKLLGDGLLAVFGGLFEPDSKTALVNALRTALEILSISTEISRVAECEIEISIGLCFGEAFVGYIGNGGYKELTVIGTPVNIASRLEQKAKPSEIIIPDIEDVRQILQEIIPKTGHIEYIPDGESVSLKGIGDLRVIRIHKTKNSP